MPFAHGKVESRCHIWNSLMDVREVRLPTTQLPLMIMRWHALMLFVVTGKSKSMTESSWVLHFSIVQSENLLLLVFIVFLANSRCRPQSCKVKDRRYATLGKQHGRYFVTPLARDSEQPELHAKMLMKGKTMLRCSEKGPLYTARISLERRYNLNSLLHTPAIRRRNRQIQHDYNALAPSFDTSRSPLCNPY